MASGLTWSSLALPVMVIAAQAHAGGPGFDMTRTNDPAKAEIEAMVDTGQARVEAFFGAPYPERVHVTLASNRGDFDKAFPADWNMGQTQCWMVGMGVADFLVLLSPADWNAEACDHDPGDNPAIPAIVTHELTHTYHGQHNPSRDFSAVDADWFVEGLATYVAGQVDDARKADLITALKAGQAPQALSAIWTGKLKYAQAGSLVAYIDQTWGRDKLTTLLSLTRTSDILVSLGVSEADLLAGWRNWVLAQG